MSGWTHAPAGETGAPFDAAVIMTTLLRPTLLAAVRSVFTQDFAGRVQILIGIDRTENDRDVLDRIRAECPPHMAVTVCDPGYATRAAYGARNRTASSKGGAMPAALSALAHSRYLAYLDDDNWWTPDHLASLRRAIDGAGWAWSLRWLVRGNDDLPLAIDRWLACGPRSGLFGPYTGGLVDTNCMMIDRVRSGDVLWRWARTMQRNGDDHDRQVFRAMQRKEPGAATGKATVYYRFDPKRESTVLMMMQRPVDRPRRPRRTALAALRAALAPPAAAPAAARPRRAAALTEVQNLLQRMLRRRQPRDIVVLGDGDGAWSIEIASAVRACDLDASVLAIDGWLPAPGDDATRGMFAMTRPGVAYARFNERLREAGVDDIVWPLAGCPRALAGVLRDLGVEVGCLVLTEGLDPASATIRAWWPLLRSDGFVVVDPGKGAALGRATGHLLVEAYGARLRRADAGERRLVTIAKQATAAALERPA